MRRDDGAVFGLFHDQTGSLRVVVDIDNNVTKEVQYDPFGGILKDTNPALRIPMGFAGGDQEWCGYGLGDGRRIPRPRKRRRSP